jgi:hypothetical protein
MRRLAVHVAVLGRASRADPQPQLRIFDQGMRRRKTT